LGAERARPGYGLAAPKATRVEIVDRLNEEVDEALADAKFRTRLAEIKADAEAA
jgi:tripartite-type tricarboxylate transporter receptor subunit TctC